MLSFAITDDHVHDAKTGKELLKNVRKRIKRIFADKGYDSKAIFNEFGSNTVIPPQKECIIKKQGITFKGENSRTD